MCYCVHIWSSSHLLQSLPAAFRWEIFFLFILLICWGFLQPWMDACAPHFMLSFLGEFLSLYVFSWSYNTLGQLLVTSFFSFFESGAIVQGCDFSLAFRLWLVFCMFSLSTQAWSFHHSQECPQGASAEWGEVWVWHWGYWGPQVSWEAPQVKFSQ